MKLYEEKMQALYETGMFYEGAKKSFLGKVNKATFFDVPGLITNTFGYYQNKSGGYTVFVTDEERGLIIWSKDFASEEEAVEYLIDSAEKNNFSYYREKEQLNFEEKGKVIIAYLQKKYGYSEAKAQKALEYLLQIPRIAFEFVWFIEKGDFLPDKFAASYYGNTAKKLSEETELTILGAFNYMVYIARKPQEALENLEKGLPRRKIFSDTELKEVQPIMEDKKPVEVEETAQPQQPVSEAAEPETTVPETAAPEAAVPQGALLEKLEALQQAVADLQQSFDDKIAEDAHKNGLFDNMHRELTKFQSGSVDRIIETMALDIIQLVDTTKGHIRVYEKKEPTEDNYKRLLRIVKGIAEDLGDILYRQNIESYRVDGHQVDVRRQKIIQTVPTDDQSKDNLVAVRAADGYEKDGKVLRPERIKIFKYNPNATEPTEK